MKYFSTRNNQLRKTFNDVLFQGLSKDGGLFLPVKWPNIDINTLRDKTYEEVALHIINPFLGDEISEENLYEIIHLTYKKFTHSKIAPLVTIDENKHILELFYGPTLSFKDYALQFLGNLFSHFVKNQNNNKNITIVGATSGDTGSAAIDAFKCKENISVFILHPHNKISEVQRRQMTTVLDKNIFNIAVEGSFDDCQKIVKELFTDNELQDKTSLTAINSINWARLMVQAVYYFWAYIQLKEELVSFVVPSGNFGNIFSAHVAQKMGLPIKNLHVVTNQNDILNQIIQFGKMKTNRVLQTYSPSMDIQISSNFERLLFDYYGRDGKAVAGVLEDFRQNQTVNFGHECWQKMRKIFEGYSVSNSEINSAIANVYKTTGELLDPHSIIGVVGGHKGHTNPANIMVALATAHPAKFPASVAEATGITPNLPTHLADLFEREERFDVLPNDIDQIRDYIVNTLEKCNTR